MGHKERDDTKAGAASANVIPLWPASSRDDLPTGYLEQVARRVRANLTDLVATADTYNLDLATEFRIAAELIQNPSGTSHPLPAVESTDLRLPNGTGGCWELVDQKGNVLGLIVGIDGRLVLAPTSWSRREVLAVGGVVLLTPLVGLAARAATASGGDTSLRLRTLRRPPGWTTSCSIRTAWTWLRRRICASKRSPSPGSTT